MADEYINELTELTAPVDADEFAVVVDTLTTPVSKKITFANLRGGAGFSCADIKWTCRQTADTGWLICDGAAVSRTTYSALYAIIGTDFGVGNGTTTFNVPDFAGKVPIAQVYRASSSPSVSPSETVELFESQGETGGELTHQLTIGELAAHTHTYLQGDDPIESYVFYEAGASETSYFTWGGPEPIPPGESGSTGQDQPHNNVQPYLVVSTAQIKT